LPVQQLWSPEFVVGESRLFRASSTSAHTIFIDIAPRQTPVVFISSEQLGLRLHSPLAFSQRFKELGPQTKMISTLAASRVSPAFAEYRQRRSITLPAVAVGVISRVVGYLPA
jgi:hypothetical protein